MPSTERLPMTAFPTSCMTKRSSVSPVTVWEFQESIFVRMAKLLANQDPVHSWIATARCALSQLTTSSKTFAIVIALRY